MLPPQEDGYKQHDKRGNTQESMFVLVVNQEPAVQPPETQVRDREKQPLAGPESGKSLKLCQSISLVLIHVFLQAANSTLSITML
jgi:hypothetical protein